MIKLFLCAAAGFCSVIKRNSKVVFAFLLLIMFLMAAGNVGSPDKSAYRIYFETVNTPDIHAAVEIGFQYLILFAKAVGLDFNGFLAGYIALCFLLLWRLMNRISMNKALALFLYMLYPFILDTDQMRSFLAQLIVLTAIAFLLKEEKPHILRYLLLALFAFLFQQSCAVFLIYGLIVLDRKKVIWLTAALAVFLLFGRFLIPVIASRFTMFNIERVANYFLNNAGKKNWYIYALFYMEIIVITLYFIQIIRRDRTHLEMRSILYGEKQFLFGELNMDVIEKINIISIALITLLPLNPHFERLMRPVLLLDYIALTNLIGPKIRYRYEVVIITALLIACLGRFATYLIGGGWESFIVPLFISGRLI